MGKINSAYNESYFELKCIFRLLQNTDFKMTGTLPMSNS